MILNWLSARYGGHTYLTGREGVLWALSGPAGANATITWFDGVTTSMRLTGVGH